MRFCRIKVLNDPVRPVPAYISRYIGIYRNFLD